MPSPVLFVELSDSEEESPPPSPEIKNNRLVLCPYTMEKMSPEIPKSNFDPYSMETQSMGSYDDALTQSLDPYDWKLLELDPPVRPYKRGADSKLPSPPKKSQMTYYFNKVVKTPSPKKSQSPPVSPSLLTTPIIPTQSLFTTPIIQRQPPRQAPRKARGLRRPEKSIVISLPKPKSKLFNVIRETYRRRVVLSRKIYTSTDKRQNQLVSPGMSGLWEFSRVGGTQSDTSQSPQSIDLVDIDAQTPEVIEQTATSVMFGKALFNFSKK